VTESPFGGCRTDASYHKDIYGIRPIERDLQNTPVWLSCGFDRAPSRDAVDRYLFDLEHV